MLHVKHIILARSRKHFCDGKAKIFSVCIVELHITVKNITILGVENMLLWRIYVAGKNEMYFDLHVKCSVLTKFRIFEVKVPKFKFNGYKLKGVGLLLFQGKKEFGTPIISI